MGIFDGGLLGLGGGQGMLNPGIGLLGNNVDQAAIRNYTLKNMLLGAGIGMLSQGPTIAPQNFGTSLGQGLAGGLTAGNVAQRDFMQQAQQAAEMKNRSQLLAIQQQQADQQKALFPGQLKEQALDVDNKSATNAALANAPPWARLAPGAYAERQLGPAPQITTLGYDGAGHPIQGWAPQYSPSQAGQPFTQPNNSVGDIGTMQPASVDQSGYVNPDSQKQLYQAMGGDQNPMAAAALQIAQNQRQFSPREASNFTLQQMVHLLNPNWQNSDYATVAGINKGFNSGAQSAQMTSAARGSGHLDDAWRKAFVLPDIGVAAANSTWNKIRSFGNAPDLSAVDPAAHIAGDESVKLATGGAGALADRQNAYDSLHLNGTAQDREAAFKTMVGQGNESVMALFSQYRQAHNGSLRGFNPDVIAKRIAITREMGNDTDGLETAYKEVTGKTYDQDLPDIINRGIGNKLDLIDWSSIEGDKFRNLKKQAYAQVNSGNVDAAYDTLVKGGAKVIGSDDKQSSNSALDAALAKYK